MKKNKSKNKEVVVYTEYSNDSAIQIAHQVLEDAFAGRTHFKNVNAVAALVKAIALKDAVNKRAEESMAKLKQKNEIEV